MYTPAEDSYFLADEIVRFLKNTKKNIRVLDMGAGSGIQAGACLKAGVSRRNILTADIDPEAVASLKGLKFQAVRSNLFSKIAGKFDLIVFNPPYLPEHPLEKGIDTTGGKKGYELILRFLKEGKSHLKKKGSILLLLSSLSKPSIVKRYARSLGYRVSEIAKKKFFFEELMVWELFLED